MVLHWLEIVKFIKNNIIKFIIGTAILTVAMFIIFNDNEEKVIKTTDVQTIAQPEQPADKTFYTEEPPSNFLFYIEFQDGREFTNHLLIEQYLLSESMLSQISAATNTELLNLIVETENKINVDYNEGGESKVIGVTRSERTSLIDLYVNVGNKEDSLRVAEYLHSLIMEGEILFLENKNIFEVKAPSVKFVDSLDGTVLSEEEPTTERSMLKFVLLLVILSSFITITVLLVKEFNSRKIKYSFTYLVEEEDTFILIDEKLDTKSDLEKLLSFSKTSNIIVVREKDNTFDTVETSQGISYVDSSLLIEQSNPIDRLIYIIEENQTSRKWYKKQRSVNISKRIPTFVVQINGNKN